MGEQENRKAYASAFASYLIRFLENSSLLNSIILYGSVAKSQSTKESDIDIFIDIKKETKKAKGKINKILDNFYRSKESIIFKLLGVENGISLIIGKLDNRPGLKRSILSDGFYLWSKVQARQKAIGTEHKVIFFWDHVGKSRTAFLNKLYGYKTKGLVYKGLLERWPATKLGKSCILIPIKNRDEFIEIAKKYRVNAKAVEVFC